MIERPTVFLSEKTVADSRFNWLNYLQLTEWLHSLTCFMTLNTDWRLTTFFILAGLTIQSETHDSTEDANTALQLYKKYEELTARGEFRNVLRQVYDDGRKSGWQIGDSITDWATWGQRKHPPPSSPQISIIQVWLLARVNPVFTRNGENKRHSHLSELGWPDRLIHKWNAPVLPNWESCLWQIWSSWKSKVNLARNSS